MLHMNFIDTFLQFLHVPIVLFRNHYFFINYQVNICLLASFEMFIYLFIFIPKVCHRLCLRHNQSTKVLNLETRILKIMSRKLLLMRNEPTNNYIMHEPNDKWKSCHISSFAEGFRVRDLFLRVVVSCRRHLSLNEILIKFSLLSFSFWHRIQPGKGSNQYFA